MNHERFLHLWDSPGQFLGEMAAAVAGAAVCWWLILVLYALS